MFPLALTLSPGGGEEKNKVCPRRGEGGLGEERYGQSSTAPGRASSNRVPAGMMVVRALRSDDGAVV
jgi:hypothetical protein